MTDDLPLFRQSDPPTSVLAAEGIAPKLGTLRAAMLAAFKAHGQATAREAAEACAVEHGGEVESYRKRAKELVRAGLLVEVGERACYITDKLATVYGVTR